MILALILTFGVPVYLALGVVVIKEAIYHGGLLATCATPNADQEDRVILALAWVLWPLSAVGMALARGSVLVTTLLFTKPGGQA